MLSRGHIYQVALEVLRLNPRGAFFFLASEQEIFLAWDQAQAKNDFPRVKREFFSQTSKSELWNDFSLSEGWTPKFYLHLDEQNRLFGNPPENLFYPAAQEDCELPLLKGVSPEEENLQYSEWEKYCSAIKNEIEQNGLKKVVPARKRKLFPENGQTISPQQKIQIFKKLLQSFPLNAHLFCYRENEDLFLGASPELLFKLKGNELFVPAIAGTRKRSSDSKEDQELGLELLHSSKEQEEHRYVVEFVKERLKDLGLKTESKAEPELLLLSNLQHLYTPIKASLENKNLNALNILKTLHPTPAMAGSPQKLALEFIALHENFDRGLYSSPLGFILPNGNARFIVGIRSLLVTVNKIEFFAGAGFVKDSQAESEWLETSQKMQTMAQLFGKNPA